MKVVIGNQIISFTNRIQLRYIKYTLQCIFENVDSCMKCIFVREKYTCEIDRKLLRSFLHD